MSGGSVDAHFRALADSGAWTALYEGPETAANTSFRVRLARTLELVPSGARRVLDDDVSRLRASLSDLRALAQRGAR